MRQEAGIDASSSSLPARRPALLHPRPITAAALAGGRCAARAACVQRLALAGWRAMGNGQWAMGNGAAAANRRIQSTGGRRASEGCVCVWLPVCEVYMVHGAWLVDGQEHVCVCVCVCERECVVCIDKTQAPLVLFVEPANHAAGSQSRRPSNRPVSNWLGRADETRHALDLGGWPGHDELADGGNTRTHSPKAHDGFPLYPSMHTRGHAMQRRHDNNSQCPQLHSSTPSLATRILTPKASQCLGSRLYVGSPCVPASATSSAPSHPHPVASPRLRASVGAIFSLALFFAFAPACMSTHGYVTAGPSSSCWLVCSHATCRHGLALDPTSDESSDMMTDVASRRPHVSMSSCCRPQSSQPAQASTTS
ncbi:hypothetical protein PSV08DRAFT_250118 [Bipolaris maydis]|uniref:uncharacterized protein n=1 Tax=Cochliobolus heterostrophus TaxID=5016 RepID=UPI0024D6292F|nr:hypothetical protein PSV08DRAFT_250118 [Bipolaris maydis]